MFCLHLGATNQAWTLGWGLPRTRRESIQPGLTPRVTAKTQRPLPSTYAPAPAPPATQFATENCRDIDRAPAGTPTPPETSAHSSAPPDQTLREQTPGNTTARNKS